MKWFEPHEIWRKSAQILDPEFRRICKIFGIFPRNFGLIKEKLNRMWRGDINDISYNRNKWCIFLTLVRIWNQRKRWLGSWHMSAIHYIIYSSSLQSCVRRWRKNNYGRWLPALFIMSLASQRLLCCGRIEKIIKWWQRLIDMKMFAIVCSIGSCYNAT